MNLIKSMKLLENITDENIKTIIKKGLSGKSLTQKQHKQVSELFFALLPELTEVNINLFSIFI